jgi:hypothetical protein
MNISNANLRMNRKSNGCCIDPRNVQNIVACASRNAMFLVNQTPTVKFEIIADFKTTEIK